MRFWFAVAHWLLAAYLESGRVRRVLAIVTGVALAGYLASGVYIVRGNEKAAVKRFGKAVRTDAGAVLLKSSGVYYDLPWPLTEVVRLKLNNVLQLTVGRPELEDIDDGQFLQAVDPARQAQFLTGDKNIMNLFVSVHYRVSEADVEDYLFGSASPQRRLQLLTESAIADSVLRSGVDFVHTLGRNELREHLLQQIRTLASLQRLGIEVEDVTIGSVYPPIRVKSRFLDVMNARAEKETYINQALAHAAQREADARAAARRIGDEAEIFRQTTVESARADADSFTKLIRQLKRDEREGIQSYAQARQMVLSRRYVEVMEEILRKVKGKVFLDSGKPVDLTIFRDPSE